MLASVMGNFHGAWWNSIQIQWYFKKAVTERHASALEFEILVLDWLLVMAKHCISLWSIVIDTTGLGYDPQC